MNTTEVVMNKLMVSADLLDNFLTVSSLLTNSVKVLFVWCRLNGIFPWSNKIKVDREFDS